MRHRLNTHRFDPETRDLAAPVPADTALQSVASAATCALYDELALYPKPGLVSLEDSGSHGDMNATTFMRSLFALRHYFRDITQSGAGHRSFTELEAHGIAAERAMLRATGGVNTHRGAIFTLGLLCAAAGGLLASAKPLTDAHLRQHLMAQWGEAIDARRHRPRATNGQRVVQTHGLRGIEQEAAEGFPTLFQTAAPTLRAALQAGLTPQEAQLHSLFATMAVLDDTNLVHRGGLAGLGWAQAQARAYLKAGGAHRADARQQARALHAEFVQRRLSPGGSADLLAAACWLVRVGVRP
jgi:triphosphoribosyl-dephospho-CoA synthase